MFLEYIWVDGTEPTAQLRSKTKVVGCLTSEYPTYKLLDHSPPQLDISKAAEFPSWGADGSSTNQATGDNSDIVLRPVKVVYDPFRVDSYLVLCEAFDENGKPLVSNYRAELRKVVEQMGEDVDPWFGLEQEYTFYNLDGRPLGFPLSGYPEPQGPYYCGVGALPIAGRDIYEAILKNCMTAGLHVSGVNFEVMPGQAEIQIGPLGPLDVSDEIWLARWIMHRTAEPKVVVNFDPKPAKGDWNGAGMHTNFSTAAMREAGGMEAITEACEKLGQNIGRHLAAYGAGIEARLTGSHETCSYKEFKYGISDRTASIRIPRHVADDGRGYLEDRRPCANADPYRICEAILRTCCLE